MSDAEDLARLGAQLYQRGLVSSTGGNASVRRSSTVLITPTGRSLADLSPEELVEVDSRGDATGSGRPSKEVPFHLGIYRARPEVNCVIHGHSPYAVAASTLLSPHPVNAFPVYTAGYLARVGRLPLIPYFSSGSAELAAAVSEVATGDTKAILLQNHGFITVGDTIESAFNTADELLDALTVYVITEGRAKPLYEADAWPKQKEIEVSA
ncbi:class II aldolase/adducin family protein [Naasia sp.]|uniref:class II aldolase/adducin family protein n=1 Tax=Naasia sp. TaxID=2546198 RepID=UPI0026212C8E|nr:class II aldolase/adducin family protein [Naasia sp.]